PDRGRKRPVGPPAQRLRPAARRCGTWGEAQEQVTEDEASSPMRARTWYLVAGLAIVALCPLPARAESPAGLKVFSATVELRGQDHRQGLSVQVVDGQGVTTDVTTAAKLRLADPALVAITGQTLAPKKDGRTQLIVEYGGLKAEVPVVVKDAAQSR